MNKGQGGVRAYRHDSTLCLLNSLDDKDTPCLDSTHGGTVDIYEVSSLSDLPTLLELRLTDIAMQRDIFVFCVQYAAF
jgi:hypothetical protein